MQPIRGTSSILVNPATVIATERRLLAHERRRLYASVDSAMQAIDKLDKEKDLRGQLSKKGLPVPDNDSLGYFLLRTYRAHIYRKAPLDDNFLGLGREVSNLLKNMDEDLQIASQITFC